MVVVVGFLSIFVIEMCFFWVMVRTQSIVLNALRYSDSQLIVGLYTRELGFIKCVVRQHRAGRPLQRSAIWQVLNTVELDIYFRQGRELQYPTDARVLFPWESIPYNPVKVTVAMFLGDMLSQALCGEGRNAALFDFLINSLRWLDVAEDGYASFHIVLLIRMTQFLGFWPNVDSGAFPCIDSTDTGGLFFDLLNGCYCCAIPAHGQYVGGRGVRLLRLLMCMNYSQMYRVRFSGNERWHILEIIISYYRLHVPGFGHLRSLDVLRELYP